MNTDKKQDRPESYPRPTETDNQLQNQPEFIDQQPNDFSDKSVSDYTTDAPGVQQTNDPAKELHERGED